MVEVGEAENYRRLKLIYLFIARKEGTAISRPPRGYLFPEFRKNRIEWFGFFKI